MHRLSSSLDQLEARTVPATITVTSLADDGTAGTLRAALARADSLPGKDTIVFKLTEPTAPHIIDLTSGELTSKGNVTITGPGAGILTISGQNSSRVFDINDGSNTTDSPVAISGLSIVSGFSTGSGGGINSTESLSLTGVVLSGNAANNGGAVFVSGSFGAKTVTINKSQVLFNSADLGGGIDLVGLTSIKLSNSTISGNTAVADSGGGVYASLNASGTGMSIAGCAVTGNTASYGGGMYLSSESTVTTARTTISNCTISGNTSTDTGSEVDGGGGLFLTGGNIAVTGSTISSNMAVYYGGGVEANDFASLTISKSTITGNQTTKTNATYQGGGGLFIQGSESAPLRPATITGCTISSNSSASYGGGTFVTGGVKLTVTSSTFSADRAAGDGGGLLTLGAGANQVAVAVAGCKFANDSCDSLGGGLAVIGDGVASVVSTKVTGCTATLAGGGLYAVSHAATNGFLMSGCTISGNSAGIGGIGGGVWIAGTPDFHISGSSITNNSAQSGGGMFVANSSGSILGTTISGNVAAVHGGGIVHESGGTVILQISKVHGNISPNIPNAEGTFTDG
jgi:fibronectin-binding autotransporter adhesin